MRVRVMPRVIVFRTYPARLTRVIDGDTVIVEVDHGFRIYSTQTVRVLGVNAPELRNPGGREAKAFVEQWTAVAGVWPLTINATATTDKYGRRLAAISKPGGDLATDLIANGHGVAA